MSSTTLAALKTKPKFVFFSDFDGTITQSDSNDYLTDNFGFGYALRRQANQDVLEGKCTFRESLQLMMDSIKMPYDQCIKTLLGNIKLDPFFLDFYEYCSKENIPIVILSGGMEPIIRTLLVNLVGEEAKNIQIVSNNVAPRPGKKIDEEGGWQIVFHDER